MEFNKGVADANHETRRITLKHGPLTRRVVLEAPPFPEVGEVMAVEGEGTAQWTVTKIQRTTVIARIPRGKVTGR